MRELSRRAADKLSSMESDPSAFADRVQSDLETRAESFGTAFRSAQSTVRDQATDLSQRAQSLLHTAFEQAEETYESLARRGEIVVHRAGERRTLPEVPGMRMIKPAPSESNIDETGEDESGQSGGAVSTETAEERASTSTTARKSGGTRKSSASRTTEKSTGKTSKQADGNGTRAGRSASGKTTGGRSGGRTTGRNGDGRASDEK